MASTSHRRAKMFMQSLWALKVGWDDELPAEYVANWIKFRNDLSDLSTLTIPRWLGSTSASYCELHGFGDASEKAIGAVVYLRVTLPSNLTRVTLVMAKTKVARLKETSIPRLELCAAVLLVKLMSHVRSVLSLSDSTPIHLWSDSENTLDWIRGQPLRWKTYISNRVAEIQRILPEAVWHHVPGLDNPADCASRGLTPVRLEHHLLWWQGPVWLVRPELLWPKSTGTIDLSVDREERVITHSALVDHETTWRLLTHYSSLTKLLRITALCLQFVDRLRGKHFERSPCHPITAYLKLALQRLIGHVQQKAFPKDIIKIQSQVPVSKSSPLLKLLPFLDSDGLLRLGGRLIHAVLDYEERCPYILPKDSPLTTLIVRNGHQFMLHGGPQLTLSYLRRRYWILSGRTAVKSVLSRCVICARHRATPRNQVMSPLPSFRVSPPVRPFAAAGLDYAGPIWIRTTKGRGHKAYKGYIAIFVCCATRAVHLEVVSDYSAEGFIAAYKRFSARRGVSHTLYSDNGTNFVGADRQLRELFSEASAESGKIARYITDNHTTWKFNPPAAPHFGGLWEAAVRSVKHHLRRVVGDTTLTFEEISTLLAQVEACLNTRPIQSLRDDPSDLVALTPGHFLLGSPIYTIPEPSLLDARLTPRERWKLVTQMFQTFWKRWSTEYLHELQTRPKWQKLNTPVKIGELVLILQEKISPTKWPLARVVQVHPGSDGQIRSVTLKTATGLLQRPIVKIVSLPISVPESTEAASS